MNASWEALRGRIGERFYHLATRWFENSPPGWPEVLPQLLEAIPGVQGASLLLREGEGYSLVAQVGYDDALLGTWESMADSLRWYGGGLEGWQNGEMRRRDGPGSAATFEGGVRYMQYSSWAKIQESLIVPLAFEGEVWGFLNLDTFAAEGFPSGLETLCQDLAAQICLLVASWRQQSAARRRQALLEAVADGQGVLRQVHGTQALYDAALSALLEHTRAQSGWILRESPEGFEVVSQRGREGNPPEGGGDFLIPLPEHAHPPTLYLSLKDQEETFSPEEQVFTRALAEALGVALEREGALAEAQERAATLRSVAELSALLESLTDPEAIARKGLEVALGFTGFELGGYFLSVHNRVRKQFLVGEYPEAFERLYQGRQQKVGEGLVGASLAQGQLLFVPDYSSSHYALEEFARNGLLSALAAPVGQSAAIALGSLRRRVELTPETQALVAFLVRRVEWALERLKHLEQIQRTRDSAFRALGLVLEYRDYETKGHTDRVVALSGRFGLALGLAEEDLEALRWGAYVHDIGKVAIPDAVLLKPGSLSEAEWDIIRRHPLIGHEILSGLPELPAGTLQVVRYHHERWDGGGYPDGLAGEAIPLLARVFALVDVYDALMSPRPYKVAWSRRKARAEIRNQAARQFDPELAEVFLKL
ncbi:MAG: HD domain-containing protein [Meiothermus silvanus]|nr:HD domain-containing protein [Allomeiothermus silvanus]